MKLLIVFLSLSYSITGFSHGGEKHEHPDVEEDLTDYEELILEDINETYLTNIKPIFKEKCFSCHAKISSYPWYYSIPGVSYMMNYDMTEAKVHLDLSKDFPFQGHGTPVSDLKALKNSIESNSMPPLRYKLMHWDHSLTDGEKEILLDWIKQSISDIEEE